MFESIYLSGKALVVCGQNKSNARFLFSIILISTPALFLFDLTIQHPPRTHDAWSRSPASLLSVPPPDRHDGMDGMMWSFYICIPSWKAGPVSACNHNHTSFPQNWPRLFPVDIWDMMMSLRVIMVLTLALVSGGLAQYEYEEEFYDYDDYQEYPDYNYKVRP